MLLALEQRKNEGQRTLGELFFLLVDEMADITFSGSLCIIMTAMIASLQELLRLSDEQLESFTAECEARLPEYLQTGPMPPETGDYPLNERDSLVFNSSIGHTHINENDTLLTFICINFDPN